jgi:ankyrin repeat protein
VQDNEGQTPLHYACVCDQEDLIAVLLRHKADANIKDKSGESPLDINAKVIESLLNSML